MRHRNNSVDNTLILTGLLAFSFVFFIIFSYYAFRDVLSDFRFGFRSAGFRSAAGKIDVGMSADKTNSEKTSADEANYAGALKNILGAIVGVDFGGFDKNRAISILEDARKRTLAVSKVPKDFKNIHLFVVLTLDKFIAKLKTGESITSSEVARELQVLYSGL